MEKRTIFSEFSSQLNDKNIVVIEFGRQYTRCGFAGEAAPRAIIKTPYQINRHDFDKVDQLQTKLGDFIEKIYFNHLAVSPKEKKVVIVESIFCNSLFRNALTRVFFDQFNVPSILFVPDHLMALATLGRSTGLVIDLGAEEAVSIAVVDGVTLLNGAQFACLGAKSLDMMISNELKNVNPGLVDLKPELIEDIRTKACFVAPFERGLKISGDKLKKSNETSRNEELSIGTLNDGFFLGEQDEKSPTDVTYSLGGRNLIRIPGNLREGACEIFFEIFGHEHSLTTMIVETILTAPIDCRRSLAENILVIGGLANMPGLEHRLFDELKHIDEYERFRRKIPDNFKFHRSICPRNYVSWLGASMFCTPTSVELRATTREQWIHNKRKSLSEWSDLQR